MHVRIYSVTAAGEFEWDEMKAASNFEKHGIFGEESGSK